MAMTNAQVQSAWRARRNEAAKNWEQLGVGEQSAVLVLPTNDKRAARAIFNEWLEKTYRRP